MMVIDVRTPSSSEPGLRQAEGRRPRRAGAHDPRDRGHQHQRQPQRRARLRRHRQEHQAQALGCRRSRATCAALTARLVGRRVHGARRPQQRRAEAGADPASTAPTRASCWRSPTPSWTSCAQVPGAVDVGLSEQDPKDELKIELDRGLANALGISVADAAQALRVAFAGVEVGDWVDPAGETRDVAVRLHPDDRVDASNIERLPIAVTGSNMMVPLEQIATVTMDKGAGADPARWTASARSRCRPTRRAARPGEVTADAHEARRERSTSRPATASNWAALRATRQEVFREMVIALVMRHRRSMYLVLVMQFGSFTAPLPVMMSLPLSLIGVVLALLVTRRHAQPDELHRRHHADGAGGQERHPAARLPRASEEAPGRRSRRGADARRPQAPAADPDDHLRARSPA